MTEATGAARLIYPLRLAQDRLHLGLRRLGPASSSTLDRGRLYVETIETLARAQKIARSMVPFDPSGL